ncbi:MAG: bifunctional (p)ppGpp synthetase/guanosine-3',5'-bis(diphosphate) 3'-pyrophosphohydrolase, partial [Firmicutes bacterium]|nr:bifunctional (p)ppGpp synthetase/guanosine-3',5'-bis(diphosphate) 3'-pyrophosphohydrolase [Bacillota bacterium]
VPGDDIVGFITKGKGVTVHRRDCPNVKSLNLEDPDRFVEVSWGDISKQPRMFEADVTILGEDRKGMFADISKVCADMDVHITAVNGQSNNDNTAQITITLSITNVNQISQIMNRLRSIKGVIEARRGIAATQ